MNKDGRASPLEQSAGEDDSQREPDPDSDPTNDDRIATAKKKALRAAQKVQQEKAGQGVHDAHELKPVGGDGKGEA
jgi:hypothetical protein